MSSPRVVATMHRRCTFQKKRKQSAIKISASQVNDLINQFQFLPSPPHASWRMLKMERTTTITSATAKLQKEKKRFFQRVEGTLIIMSQFPNQETNFVCDFCHQPPHERRRRSETTNFLFFFSVFVLNINTRKYSNEIGEQWHCALCTHRRQLLDRKIDKVSSSLIVDRRRRSRHDDHSWTKSQELLFLKPEKWWDTNKNETKTAHLQRTNLTHSRLACILLVYFNLDNDERKKIKIKIEISSRL